MLRHRHKKTGDIYLLLAHATDKTNNDKLVAVYCPDDNEHCIYVRELEDFENKFEMVSTE